MAKARFSTNLIARALQALLAGACMLSSAACHDGAVPMEPNPGTPKLSVSRQELLWTAVRYYAGGTGINNRTSGPRGGPKQALRVENTGPATADLSVGLGGRDAERFRIVDPPAPPVTLDAGTGLDIALQIETDNARLEPAPAQDDGATVLQAELSISSGDFETKVRLYGLVLTYAELEPTFGQVLDAFSNYDSQIPSTLRNDANPNPATLPGIETGNDEVAATAFTPADPDRPVVLVPLARFSPPGPVPFGWYPSADPGQLHPVGSLAFERDPQTSDKSRMLNPPLADGTTRFEVHGGFGVWLKPDAANVLYTDDNENFDGQHRMRVFAMRDRDGKVIPATFLLGSEEASNGDYQDYVFMLSNAEPL